MFKFIISLVMLFAMEGVQAQELVLNWSILHPLKNTWIEIGPKGTVQEALIASGELPDPFYGKNEERFSWIEEHVWEFRSLFFLDESFTQREFAQLFFESIDTYADVSINGIPVGRTDNAFIPHRFDIDTLIKKGLNEVIVRFTPPVIEHESRFKEGPFHFPAPNDSHEIAIAPLTRKPQYQFGWDWSLRMNTIGFNAPVRLQAFNHNKVLNKTTTIRAISSDEALVEFALYLAKPSTEKMIWESRQFGNLEVEPDGVQLKRTCSVENPKLWWPKSYGDPFLYEDIILIKTTEGVLVDSIHFTYGIKKSELIIEPDPWGTSYFFKVNDQPVFCKGANYIPQDIFPGRISDDEIVKMVELMAASNFNMVRVWGGGYYQREVFYETCDRLGIMVWQDLMFACSMYPGDSSFLANVNRELSYQVPRIAGHASTVLFNGNNEVEVAWGNWGFQIKYGLYGDAAREIEQAYTDLFKTLAPRVVVENSTIPYIHTSPLSNWGKAELYNHGSQHYWGVWHGKDPIEDFGKKIGRFNAEYGFQSFPEFSTLKSFSEESDWDIHSEVMKQHQKSYVGNDMILKQAKRLYGTPKDFEEFVYFSQLTQMKAVSMAVSGHRLDAPRCGGTLYWQLNDCWPVSSWSSVDYFGNKKALHYRISEDYTPVTVLEKYTTLSERSYHVVSDLPDTTEAVLRCEIYSLKGKLEAKWEEHHTLTFLESAELNMPELKHLCQKKYPDPFVLKVQIEHDGITEQRTFFQDSSPHKKADRRGVSVSLTDIDSMKKTAVLQVINEDFVADLWISSLVQGVNFGDNFVNLLPGKQEIQITFTTIPKLDDFKLMWR